MKVADTELTGRVVGKLTVVERASRTMWLCKCPCGATMNVSVYKLVSGGNRVLTTACRRCCQKTHGLKGSRVYKTWSSMRERCYQKTNASFAHYGGRGIKVCDRWRASAATFLEDMGHPPEGMSLDRIDNDGDYTPDNCRWATDKQQERNKRSSAVLEYEGVSQTIIEWSEQTGINAMTLYARRRKGWAPKEVLFGRPFPKRARNPDGTFLSVPSV